MNTKRFKWEAVSALDTAMGFRNKCISASRQPLSLYYKRARVMIKLDHRNGFTLIEIVLVVAIIGLLTALIVPAVQQAICSRENAQAASKLRRALVAFELYRSEMGSYPADKNPGQIPPEMIPYFADLKIDSWWSSGTELGGGWDWDNGYNFKYSVSISAPTRSSGQMIEFDRLIDDGVLTSGNFRSVGSQYHYIIER
jgi:prepilin-type N-terminal cleavage/methylation domain-containing protein